MGIKCIDLLGRKFGLLTVVEKTDKRSKRGHIIWLCQCDCGNTKEARGSHLYGGTVKSCGCLLKKFGKDNPRWRGDGARRKARGYMIVRIGEKWILEHRVKAEKALGRPLKKDEVVHHINGMPSDNRNKNLLICDRGYHAWLHNNMSRLYMNEHFIEM